MWLRCGCDVVAVWLRCGCDVVAMWMRCDCGVVAMWLRCGCDVAAVCVVAMWLRCGCGVVAVWLRCGCGVAHTRHRSSGVILARHRRVGPKTYRIFVLSYFCMGFLRAICITDENLKNQTSYPITAPS